MSIDQLIHDGARLEIHFHNCVSLDDAYKKLTPYKHLGELVYRQHEGLKWMSIRSKHLNVNAFLQIKEKDLLEQALSK